MEKADTKYPDDLREHADSEKMFVRGEIHPCNQAEIRELLAQAKEAVKIFCEVLDAKECELSPDQNLQPRKRKKTT